MRPARPGPDDLHGIRHDRHDRDRHAGSHRRAFTQLFEEIRAFAPTHARASTDGAAAFVQKTGYKEQSVYFFDMANNKAHTSTELRAAQNLTWVYDDLLVGVTDEGLTAFTPTSS